MQRLAVGLAGLLLTVFTTVGAAAPPSAQPSLQFDGSSYIEVPDSSDFSVSATAGLTISAWMRPDVLSFSASEGSGYVYWLGKGERGQQEWVFRMYSADNTEHRANRISFYLFNSQGGLGIGSYFQDPITPGEWIHVVGVADTERTAIYKNGVFRKCDQYRGSGDGSCQQYRDLSIAPQHGTAPLRMGTRDFGSYFQGGLAEVRIWNRALAGDEIAELYATDTVPPNGLVAEYLLTEGAGSVAHDTLGDHDGTIVGATWSIAASTVAGHAVPSSHGWHPW